MFCDFLRGVPLRTLFCEVVEKTKVQKVKPWMVLKVPEAMGVHPAFPVAMVFLPCLFINFELHALFCELRTLLRKSNQLNISLSLLRKAVTAFLVRRNASYECLELLGGCTQFFSYCKYLRGAFSDSVRNNSLVNIYLLLSFTVL